MHINTTLLSIIWQTLNFLHRIILVQIAPIPKAFSDNHSDYWTENNPGHKIRKPMDADRNAKSDIKRVSYRQISDQFFSRIKKNQGYCHGESDCRVRWWPAPKYSIIEKTEMKNLTDIASGICQNFQWMRSASDWFVKRRDDYSKNSGLPQSKSYIFYFEFFLYQTNNENAERNKEWEDSAQTYSWEE